LNSSKSDKNFNLARKERILRMRAGLIQAIRDYFISNDFLEVETPLRVPAPAPEEHIEAVPSGNWFLQTSPELCMKRLLAAGYPRIFQISKCFRAGERGNMHLTEFTMLEWYEAQSDYMSIMQQCRSMLVCVCREMGFDKVIRWQEKEIALCVPWEELTVAQAFDTYAPLSSQEAFIQNRFEEILVDYVEPNLGIRRPTFLYDYPAGLSALAKLKDTDKNIAERFELYLGSVELANGFSELNDAQEQRERFQAASDAMKQKNWETYPMPEKFLESLDNLPPSAGAALGIDRLVMLLSGTARIDDVVTFTPESL